MNVFERFQRMVAADSEPQLSSDECGAILELFAVSDKDGNLPSAPEWTPTYRLNAAAAEAWRWKAAKASELVSIDLDGERMSSNQVFDQCERMIRHYSRKQTADVGFGR